jgi:hypothetical protein
LNFGYKLENIQGFAFYPQTFHLEIMAVFSACLSSPIFPSKP